MSFLISGNPKVSYINASPIFFPGQTQSFIATQAPKPNSFVNFWQMIVEKKVKIVVNLSSLDEKDQQYSAEESYFPVQNNPIEFANEVKLELKRTIVQDFHEQR